MSKHRRVILEALLQQQCAFLLVVSCDSGSLSQQQQQQRAFLLVEELVVVRDERLYEFALVLDGGQAGQRVRLRGAQQRRREHYGQVLRVHHVLLLLLRHPEIEEKVICQ